jgi:hypothetical protein
MQHTEPLSRADRFWLRAMSVLVSAWVIFLGAGAGYLLSILWSEGLPK